MVQSRIISGMYGKTKENDMQGNGAMGSVS